MEVLFIFLFIAIVFAIYYGNSILKIGIYKLINSAKDKIENRVAEQKAKQGQTEKREKL